jgi:hypothetical protein
MVTNWFSTDEIDACNDDLVVVIIEVIEGNSIEEKTSNFIDRLI